MIPLTKRCYIGNSDSSFHRTVIKQVYKVCSLFAYNNLGKSKLLPLLETIQRRVTYLGEDWQLDFTICHHVEDLSRWWS